MSNLHQTDMELGQDDQVSSSGTFDGLARQMFALIIGINDYSEFKPLKCCVKDAGSVSRYLVGAGVSQDHITELYNEKATRAAIINGLQRLADDDRIKKDDAILIFYAGHGSQMQAPSDWDTDGQKVQALIPFDAKTLGSDGRSIEVIPDRTFGILLDKIAEKKGDNITVILDCCHSTSGTRDDEEDLTARSIDEEDLPPLSSNVDKDICESDSGGRASIIPAGFAHKSLRSHVVLAACEASEKAWEEDGHGNFTRAILSVLEAAMTNQLTYVELMQSLGEIKRQHPQCEGINRNRAVFNSALAGASRGMTRVEVKETGALLLHAGLIQGVTQGALFEVYQHHLMGDFNPCLGILEVTSIIESTSTLGSIGALPGLRNPAYARQIRVGRDQELMVYVSPALQKIFESNSKWQTQFLSQNSDLGARPILDKNQANLSLDLSPDGRVTFCIHNPVVNQNGMTILPSTTETDADAVLDVLSSAAAWNWHLSRTNPKGPWSDQLKIEMYRVKRDFMHCDQYGQPMISKEGENLNKSGLVDIVADPTQLYGYRIVNDTDSDLHPYLFYFDASMLSIMPYYLGSVPSSAKVDISLPRRGQLSIGYGTSGRVPFAYMLEDGQNFDLGLIKLFVTDTPVDFGLLEQESPFEEGGRGNVRGIKVGRAMKSIQWDTKIMILAQHNELPDPIHSAEQIESESASPPAKAGLKTPASASPSIPPTKVASIQAVSKRKYDLWVVFPLALALSCIPFIAFYLSTRS
ncbi:ICE-like protease (caspase) p20 domain protein [Ceratobasidium sp. AG-Ba]|nr:ICE-like protease (caspase) p20 domain protein [Ceratobasidium sp. AG-Ba]